MVDEPLIFEIGSPERSGVDLPEAPAVESRLGGLEREAPIGHSRPVRSRNGAPLHPAQPPELCHRRGSVPARQLHDEAQPAAQRENGAAARALPTFIRLQPVDSVQGALELIHELAEWLKTLTGMPAVAMSPKAGAHGELCGILAIRSALEARGDAREVILVPESAHGTNPATAAFAGYKVENIPANKDGRVDLEALKARLVPMSPVS